MSNKARSTAVLPNKYYVKELENVDPRFYVEKDIVAIVTYEVEEAQLPEEAVVVNTSVVNKTIIVTQELVTLEEPRQSNNNFKKKYTQPTF